MDSDEIANRTGTEFQMTKSSTVCVGVDCEDRFKCHNCNWKLYIISKDPKDSSNIYPCTCESAKKNFEIIKNLIFCSKK